MVHYYIVDAAVLLTSNVVHLGIVLMHDFAVFVILQGFYPKILSKLHHHSPTMVQS